MTREQAMAIFEHFEREHITCTLTYRHIPNFAPGESWALAVQVAFHQGTHEHLRKIMQVAEEHDCEMQLSVEAGMANIVEKAAPGAGPILSQLGGGNQSAKPGQKLRSVGRKS